MRIGAAASRHAASPNFWPALQLRIFRHIGTRVIGLGLARMFSGWNRAMGESLKSYSKKLDDDRIALESLFYKRELCTVLLSARDADANSIAIDILIDQCKQRIDTTTMAMVRHQILEDCTLSQTQRKTLEDRMGADLDGLQEPFPDCVC